MNIRGVWVLGWSFKADEILRVYLDGSFYYPSNVSWSPEDSYLGEVYVVVYIGVETNSTTLCFCDTNCTTNKNIKIHFFSNRIRGILKDENEGSSLTTSYRSICVHQSCLWQESLRESACFTKDRYLSHEFRFLKINPQLTLFGFKFFTFQHSS